jgi:nicotinamide riboside kinase
MKILYIIGAQSTGKTTLVNALEEHFDLCRSPQEARPSQPLIIREVARTVLKEKGFNREDITTSPTRALQLQKHILDAQHNAECEINVSSTPKWYICDRSGLDPIVYTKYFVGQEASAEMLASRSWIELESRMKAGIVILCEAGCHWLKDDGIRLMPNHADEWTRIDDTFRSLLEEREIQYYVLPKDLADLGERVDFVRGLIDTSCR